MGEEGEVCVGNYDKGVSVSTPLVLCGEVMEIGWD